MAVAFVQEHWIVDRAVDMTGQTVNGCLVIERVTGINKSARWRCVGACGHEVMITRNDLARREKEGLLPYFCKPCAAVRLKANRLKNRKPITDRKSCTTCHIEKLLTEFHRDNANRDNRQSRCKLCDRTGDPNRKAEPVDCRQCADQPWRRPETELCACGARYEAEDMRTARYLIMTGNSGRDSVLPDWEV